MPYSTGNVDTEGGGSYQEFGQLMPKLPAPNSYYDRFKTWLNEPTEFGGPPISSGNGLVGYGPTPESRARMDAAQMTRRAIDSGNTGYLQQALDQFNQWAPQQDDQRRMDQSFKKKKLDFYEQIGQALGTQAAAINLNSGFDPNWLAQQLSAGSANGARIGGMGSGGGGKSKGIAERFEKLGLDEGTGPGKSAGIGGASIGIGGGGF